MEGAWAICAGSEAPRIDAAIDATRHFVEGLGIPTRLCCDGLDMAAALGQLDAHAMTGLGGHGDVDLALGRATLETVL